MKDISSIFEKMEGNHRVAIFTHPEPDPDAMGSCLGMQLLLKKKWGIDSEIFMEGDYSSRRQNSAMVNIMGIDLKQMSDFIGKTKKYSIGIILDSTPERIAAEEAVSIIRVVIDHHNVQINKDSFDYVDIRKVGSCCTMVFELMKAHGAMPDGDIEGERMVATAMLEGIRTDTDMYRRHDTTPSDFAASSALFEIADMDIINQIERCKLPRYHFEMRAEIIRDENCEVVNGSTYIACAGLIPRTRLDSLPILADEVINDMEGISTSIIFGVVDNKVELRMRSNEVSLDVNRFLKRHFGDHGGAKYGSGGASIPLGIFGMPAIPNELRSEVFDVTKKVIITTLSQDVKSE